MNVTDRQVYLHTDTKKTTRRVCRAGGGGGGGGICVTDRQTDMYVHMNITNGWTCTEYTFNGDSARM